MHHLVLLEHNSSSCIISTLFIFSQTVLTPFSSLAEHFYEIFMLHPSPSSACAHGSDSRSQRDSDMLGWRRTKRNEIVCNIFILFYPIFPHLSLSLVRSLTLWKYIHHEDAIRWNSDEILLELFLYLCTTTNSHAWVSECMILFFIGSLHFHSFFLSRWK